MARPVLAVAAAQEDAAAQEREVAREDEVAQVGEVVREEDAATRGVDSRRRPTVALTKASTVNRAAIRNRVKAPTLVPNRFRSPPRRARTMFRKENLIHCAPASTAWPNEAGVDVGADRVARVAGPIALADQAILRARTADSRWRRRLPGQMPGTAFEGC